MSDYVDPPADQEVPMLHRIEVMANSPAACARREWLRAQTSF